MRTEGFVKSVNGNLCEVIISRRSACGENCASCSGGCGQQKQICDAVNEANAGVGDKVIIEMDSAVVLRSAFLVYIMPILLFLAVFAAVKIGYNEKSAAIAAVASMIFAFFALHRYDKRLQKKYISYVVEIISKNT